MIQKSGFVYLSLSLLLVAGCGSSKPDAATVDAAPYKPASDMQVAKIRGTSASIAVPKAWTVVDPKDEVFKKNLAAILARSPELKTAVDLVESGQIAFYALDNSGKDKNFAQNVNIIVKPGNTIEVGDNELNQVKAEIGKLSGGVVSESGIVDLPAGKAARYVASLTFNIGSREISTTTVGFVARNKDTQLTISVTGTKADRAGTIKLADEIAASLRMK